MKREEIEQRIRDFIARQEDTHVDTDLDNHLKTTIFSEIEKKINPTRQIPFSWWAAASILGIILAFSISFFHQQNAEITYLKTELEKRDEINTTILSQLTQLQHEQMRSQNTPQNVDTVYKTKTIYRTIYQTNNITPRNEPFAGLIDSMAIQPEEAPQKLSVLSDKEIRMNTRDSIKIEELSHWEESFDIIIDPTAEILQYKIDFDKVISTFIKLNDYNNCPVF
jgi:hypothetical protein